MWVYVVKLYLQSKHLPFSNAASPECVYIRGRWNTGYTCIIHPAERVLSLHRKIRENHKYPLLGEATKKALLELCVYECKQFTHCGCGGT